MSAILGKTKDLSPFPLTPDVLVVPNRVVSRLSDLTQDEIGDLFGSVKTIGLAIEKAYNAQSLTIAMQASSVASSF